MNNTKLFEVWRRYLDGKEEKTVINERMDYMDVKAPAADPVFVDADEEEDEDDKGACDSVYEALHAAGIDTAADLAVTQAVAKNPALLKLFLFALAEKLGIRITAGAVSGGFAFLLLVPDIIQVLKNPKCVALVLKMVELHVNEDLAQWAKEIAAGWGFLGTEAEEQEREASAKETLARLLGAGPQAEV